MTGVPESQLRRATRASEKAAAKEARRPLDAPRPLSETNPHLGPSPVPSGFAPAPFSSEPSGSGSHKSVSENAGSFVILNGVVYYDTVNEILKKTNIWTDGTEDAL